MTEQVKALKPVPKKGRVRPRVYSMCDGPTKVEQSHVDECDVNKIVARFKKSGFLPEAARGGMYGDFTSITDYQTAAFRLQDAKNDFAGLPSHIRRRFGNDPGRLIEFVSDESNYDEAVELGLIEARPVEIDETPPPVVEDAEAGEAG